MKTLLLQQRVSFVSGPSIAIFPRLRKNEVAFLLLGVWLAHSKPIEKEETLRSSNVCDQALSDVGASAWFAAHQSLSSGAAKTSPVICTPV